jgi:hypothetical protein
MRWIGDSARPTCDMPASASTPLSAHRPTLTRVKLLAASRPTNDTTADPHTFEVDLDDHHGDWDEALASARASVPEGWVLLSVQRG